MIDNTVCIKGAGEMASAVAWRLFMANIRNIVMLEVPEPVAVRRRVSFCEAVYDGIQTVEGVRAVRADNVDSVRSLWNQGKIAVVVDPEWKMQRQIRPDVVVDAILAKRNLGTSISEAQLVIALGPGFWAGCDAHYVIETNRGHNLGRIIESGSAEPNTGIPGSIDGYTVERVLRATETGVFTQCGEIGNSVQCGDIIGRVNGTDVTASIGGVLRGLIRSGTYVSRKMKIGDIDPRGDAAACHTISDKARAIAGSVLEAIFRVKPVQGDRPLDFVHQYSTSGWPGYEKDLAPPGIRPWTAAAGAAAKPTIQTNNRRFLWVGQLQQGTPATREGLAGLKPVLAEEGL